MHTPRFVLPALAPALVLLAAAHPAPGSASARPAAVLQGDDEGDAVPCQCAYKLKVVVENPKFGKVTCTEGPLSATPTCNDANGCSELQNCDADAGLAVITFPVWVLVAGDVDVSVNGQPLGTIAHQTSTALIASVGGDPVVCTASGSVESAGDQIDFDFEMENAFGGGTTPYTASITVYDECTKCVGHPEGQ